VAGRDADRRSGVIKAGFSRRARRGNADAPVGNDKVKSEDREPEIDIRENQEGLLLVRWTDKQKAAGTGLENKLEQEGR
jgi:hypothetical protein